jgi:hypothetical protein
MTFDVVIVGDFVVMVVVLMMGLVFDLLFDKCTKDVFEMLVSVLNDGADLMPK